MDMGSLQRASAILCFLGLTSASVARGELRHHWPLDDRSGLEATEVVSGADGNLRGFGNPDDSHWVEGKLRGGLSLGTGSTLSNHVVADIPAMDASATGGFTIALWIRPGSVVARPGEYQLFNAPGGGIGFTIYNDTFQGIAHNRVLLLWDGDLARIIVGTTRLTPGTWYHVAVTSTGLGGVRQLYVNGARQTKRLFVSSGGVDQGNSNGWPAGAAMLGAFNSAGGRWHDSVIDDVRIYDTALSEEEILEVFSAEPPEDRFVRGDANSDGEVNITDGIVVLNYLFLGGETPGCMDAADVDDDGQDTPTITDAIRLFNWLFLGGEPPADPSPDDGAYGPDSCGVDWTDDAMGCEAPAGQCE